MCGIAGVFRKSNKANCAAAVDEALALLAHRGPDDSGIFSQAMPAGNLCLGQTRLSIIDLSKRGHQPMFVEDGSLGIVYNGEIYNYKELRRDLVSEGWTFNTETDTEVLLKCWAAWGAACLPRLEGMFAFAVLDQRSRSLTCVRDAFGIKPFFYSASHGDFVFASEIRAISALRTSRPDADLERAYAYLVHADYDSSDSTFVNGVKHLRPGAMLRLDLDTGKVADPQTWWRPDPSSAADISFADASDVLREKFLESIRIHLRSDVPLGAALSGGIDSSAVVCAMHHIAPENPIHTFSYIAEDSDLSEERWVDIVNATVGATPHKVYATVSDFERDLDDIVRVQGEPFGSTSIYAQYRVFRHARENGIVVTFDGQGADELLAGYDGFPGQRMLSLVEQREFRALLEFLRRWSEWPGRTTARAIAHLGRLVLADGLYAAARKRLGRDYRPQWLDLDAFEKQGVAFTERRPKRSKVNRGRRVAEQLAYNLQVRGLPHLLRHGDRNAMAFSIESRVPFLTVSMAEFLLSLPEHYLISQTGETKSVFRAAMRGIVPDIILDRKDKIGFATPEQRWFQQIMPKLREWLEDADAVPFIDRQSLIREFDEVMAGRRPFSWQIWRWVNYTRWYHNAIAN